MATQILQVNFKFNVPRAQFEDNASSLAQAFAEAKARMGEAELHAITMTGELADTFSSRAEGVEKLSALAVRELAPGHRPGVRDHPCRAHAATSVASLRSVRCRKTSSRVGRRTARSICG